MRRPTRDHVLTQQGGYITGAADRARFKIAARRDSVVLLGILGNLIK